MLLSNDERKKFAEWLRQDVISNRLLLRQLENMPHLKLLADRKRMEAEAEEMVADLLENTYDG